jgi:hypothetical protein
MAHELDKETYEHVKKTLSDLNKDAAESWATSAAKMMADLKRKSAPFGNSGSDPDEKETNND